MAREKGHNAKAINGNLIVDNTVFEVEDISDQPNNYYVSSSFLSLLVL